MDLPSTTTTTIVPIVVVNGVVGGEVDPAAANNSWLVTPLEEVEEAAVGNDHVLHGHYC